MGLHGIAMRTVAITAHKADAVINDHDTIRCEPPGDSRRYKNKTDSFDTSIT